jgi:hypothetical protein
MGKTAVEWLVNEIAEKYNFRFATYYGQEIQQAIEMEKQQIIDAYAEAENNCEWLIEEHKWQRFHSEQYYNKTFKNQLQG